MYSGKEISNRLVMSEMDTRERGQGVALFDIMTLLLLLLLLLLSRFSCV
jgi:Tfp pilus assembly protein PilX